MDYVRLWVLHQICTKSIQVSLASNASTASTNGQTKAVKRELQVWSFLFGISIASSLLISQVSKCGQSSAHHEGREPCTIFLSPGKTDGRRNANTAQ